MTNRPLLTILVIASTLCVLASACGSAPRPAATASSKAARPHVATTRARSTTTTTTSPARTTAPASTTSTTVPPATTSSTTTPPAAPTTTTVVPSACSSNLADGLASTGGAAQLVTVDAPTYATTYATLTAWQRQGSCWVAAYGPWTARIGADGFTDHHVEGDNSTPTGDYGIGAVMYGNAPNPGVQYAYHQLVCGDWWDEDPSSPDYNTFQHVPCGETPPFGGGSEALWQETTAYPSFAVVDFNTSPVVPGAGSAIFLHADVGGPTAGCVSLPLGELDEVLRWLSPGASPLIVMGPDSEISGF